LEVLPKGAPARVLAKIEGRNPAYSVKCRIGAAMIWDAEKRGQAQAGQQGRHRRGDLAATRASRSRSSPPRAGTHHADHARDDVLERRRVLGRRSAPSWC
jgi:hypothetical protein